MAQGRLIPFAVGTAILVGGAAAEVAAQSPIAAAVLDWIVGAAFVVAALRDHATLNTAVGLATAAAWFLASLPAARSGVLHDASVITVLAYRGPLLHWLVLHARMTNGHAIVRVLVVIGYVVALTGTVASAVGTCAVAAGLAAAVFWASHRAGLPADLRRAQDRTAMILALLALLWAVAVVGALPGPTSQALTAAILVAVAWHLSRPVGVGALTDAVGRLVLELGPADRPASPLRASLARALADDDLQIRTYQPETGWTDELGHAVPDPVTAGDGRMLTEVAAPSGGRVVLVHGQRALGDTELARAAAGAAALVVNSFRVEAQVRRQADEVRRSSTRLITVEDAERQALANRLRIGPIGRLERVRLMFHRRDPDKMAPVITELDHVIAELIGLAQGLNPAAVSLGSLPEALEELIAHVGLPVRLELHGDIAVLPQDTTALVYFVIAECLTNITRHAQAGWASISVRAEEPLTIEIADNGRGGAILTTGRGLQGLADRLAVAAGTLEISSPPGGPTRIRAQVATSR